MIEPVTTARMALRAITMDDVDRLVALDTDPEVMRFINGGRPTPRDEAARIVERSIGHRWLAFERDGDAFVGWFGLRPSGPHERELGYRLRRACWGHGLATEGALALIDLALRHPFHAQAKSDVVIQTQMREQRVRLKDGVYRSAMSWNEFSIRSSCPLATPR